MFDGSTGTIDSVTTKSPFAGAVWSAIHLSAHICHFADYRFDLDQIPHYDIYHLAPRRNDRLDGNPAQCSAGLDGPHSVPLITDPETTLGGALGQHICDWSWVGSSISAWTDLSTASLRRRGIRRPSWQCCRIFCHKKPAFAVQVQER